MSRLSVVRWGAIVLFFLFGNVIFGLFNEFSEPFSDSRSLRWSRFDVTIDSINTSANRFDVTESYILDIERGPYSYGFAEIPLGRVTRIDNISIYDAGTRLNPNCFTSAGTACVTQDDKNVSIEYYFLRPAQTGEQRQIRIEYTVHGALRSYDKGDELFWVALPEDLSGFDVEASRVTVTMPQDAPALLWTSYPDEGWTVTTEGNTLTWESPRRPSDDGSFEVRIKYPHNPAMKKPSWQTRYDLEQQYIDDIRPLVTLLLGAFTVLLTVGGVLLVVLRYLRHGRDPAAITVPEYLTAPPSDEAPGVVGLLLDEKADMKDVMATFVDLARREYFVIEQKEERTLGLFSKTSFIFHRTDKEAGDLKSFEDKLLKGIFPKGRTETELNQLREKFYGLIPAIKQMMYNELVQAGYFKQSPETTRSIWLWGSIAVIVVASVGFWLSRSATLVSPLISLPPIGLGIVGAVGLLFADSMPAKTEKGAQQAALWRAFRRYLQNITRYQGDQPVDEQFQKYLPYATAFGIEQQFMRELAPTLTKMPTFYHPTYMGGPWRGGYQGRRTVIGGGSVGSGSGAGIDLPGGDFSLGGLDRSLGEGLNSMNRGLTQVLNETSRVMNTRPKNSGSGGRGGGFSGGGRGGGSGGGSRGFG